jgi:tetratricopeptide (TPR) repeat protein
MADPRREEALAATERAAEMARSLGDNQLLAMADERRGMALCLLQRYGEAREALRRAVSLAEPAGNLETAALAHSWLADIGSGVKERHHHERAFELAERSGAPERVGFYGGNMAWGSFFTGDWGQAQIDAERTLTILEGMGAASEATLAKGDADAALEMALTSAERAIATGEPEALKEPLRVQGLILREQGRWEEAAEAFEAALSIARKHHDVVSEAHILHEHGRMAALQGEPREARARLGEALVIFRRLGAQPYVDRTEQALAELD